MEKKIFIPKDKNLLDPRVDSTFKTLFTQRGKGSKIALRNLIKAIVGYEPKEVRVVNNELPKDIAYAKDIRLDLQCRMKNGSRIDIEMQTFMEGDNLNKRAIYYGCRMMSGIEMKGKRYSSLPKVYQVMFTDFKLFKNSNTYLQKFTVRNEKLELSDNLQFIFIQMPLLKLEGKNEKNFTDIEKWIIFLKYSTDKEKRDLLNKIMGSNEGIREAGEILMTISKKDREWAIQESRYKGKVDYQSGMLESRDKGRAEGRAEGLETAARGMKTKNIPVETIIEITGLTAEQIAAL